MILANLLSRIFGRAARTATADRRAVDEYLQQGYRSQRAGEHAAAQRGYRRALELDPHSADAHHLLGASLGETGSLAEAAAHLDQALALRPDFADAHAARGNVFLLQENHSAAAASYERALRIDPAHATAHFNLGLIHQGAGRRDEALRHFERAYAITPDLPDLLKNLTLLRVELQRFDEAHAVLQRVLQQQPQRRDALKCFGFVLQKTHRPDEALQYYLRARALGDADPELLNNLGIVLQDLGRLDEAIASYDAAIALQPDFALALFHRSLAYLLRYEFARGWPDYELRLISAEQPHRPTEFPRWDGAALAGKKLLVYSEQGLGDEIMFASCLPRVIASSAHCVIECSAKLETIFRRSFPAATVYASSTDKALPQNVRDMEMDIQSPSGSLPLHLRRERADFPRHQGYLEADPRRVEDWRARLAALGPGLKVGISWYGGTHKTRRPVRSLPLPEWQPILQVRNVCFIDLQYAACHAELDALQAQTGVQVHSWDEARADYEDTAALVSALDLVVSVCTAVIHLGGSLGRPVWVLAPFSPEWRYGIAGEAMVWYPSVRVFRQPAYGAWAPVVDKVARSLREMAYPE